MPTGTATVDFGALPGGDEAKVTVTGQTAIASGAKVEAWLQEATTGNNDAAMHRQAGALLEAVCGNIVAGTGFDVTVYCALGKAVGQFVVQWVWTN